MKRSHTSEALAAWYMARDAKKAKTKKTKLWRMKCGVSGKEFRLAADDLKAAKKSAEWLGLTLLDDYERVMAFDERAWM